MKPHLETTNLEALCLDQLAAEESTLSQALQTARQLQAALREHGYQALLEALQAQHDAVLASDDMRQRRQQFREQVARLLGLAPSTVTLRLLSKHLRPAAAAQLEQGRVRLAQLAQEVQQLNERNQSHLQHRLGFWERYFQEILGGFVSPRYGPAGKVQAPQQASVSLIEVRG